MIDHLGGVRNDAVRVNINGLDPLAVDYDLAPAMRMRPGRAAAASRRRTEARSNLATGKDDVGPEAGSHAGQMVPAFWHIDPPKHRRHSRARRAYTGAGRESRAFRCVLNRVVYPLC